MTAETEQIAPIWEPRPLCGETSADFGVECTERAGHRNAGWHYDEVNDITFRQGCYLPGPDEG